MRSTKGHILLSLGVLASVAFAHARLTGSVPAEGATVAAPTQILLTFSEAAVITTASIQRTGGSSQKLTDLPTVAAARVTLALPKLPAGNYTLTWRVIGDDGHVMTGALHFAVSDSVAAGTAPVQAPGR